MVSPLKVSRHCDLSVDQSLHDPADHLVQRARHVLVQLSLKAPLHLLPAERSRERLKRNKFSMLESYGAKVLSIADKIILTVTRGPSPTHRAADIKAGFKKKKNPSYSLAHAESEVNIFVFGEEENEEMIACLALLNGWIQADLKDRASKDTAQ